MSSLNSENCWKPVVTYNCHSVATNGKRDGSKKVVVGAIQQPQLAWFNNRQEGSTTRYRTYEENADKQKDIIKMNYGNHLQIT